LSVARRGDGAYTRAPRGSSRRRIAATSAPLHATPPPSTTRGRSCARAARNVFSTSVSTSASWNARAIPARSAASAERASASRTACSTAVLSPLNDTS
jgi:hypothetical protein